MPYQFYFFSFPMDLTTLLANTSTLFVVIVVIVGVLIVSKYNGMVKWRNILKQSLADIDVQLKQRFDLIPNLIETVKGYMEHEQGVLEAVTKARTAFLDASTTTEKMGADTMLSGALKSIFAVAESYPDLKANQNFLQLQSELADIENKIAAARRFFNSTVQEYNTYIQIFPNNLIASLFWFGEEKSFEITTGAEKEPVKVAF